MYCDTGDIKRAGYIRTGSAQDRFGAVEFDILNPYRSGAVLKFPSQ